jgi:hypothetical protein
MQNNTTKYENLFLIFSAGQMLAGDFEILLEFSKNKELIVELGTARGISAMILSAQGGKVITVDNCDRIDNVQGMTYFEDGILREKRHKVLNDYLSSFNNIEVRKGDTIDVGNDYTECNIDLLYIDADHRYEGVRNDFYNWFPKVKKGGYILFHDYHDIHPGVYKFVNELLENECKNNILEEINYITEQRTIIKVFRKI